MGGRIDWALAFVLVTLQVIPAFANPSPSEAALAREQVHFGVAAAREGRWAAALDAFRRAQALIPLATTLLNVASAEAQTGDVVGAASSYRRVVGAPTGELSDDQREAARQALEQVERRIAHLRVRVRPARAGDRVELDGTDMSPAALDADLPVNPGPHIVRLVRNGTEAARRKRDLRDGEFATVTLEGAEPAASPLREQHSLFASPWFWTGVGLIVAAGTFTILCVTTLCEGPPARAGTLGTVTLP